MTNEADVYDLGEIAGAARQAQNPRASGAGVRRPGAVAARREVRAASRGESPGPRLTSSLSIFVPGLGQTAAGEPRWGLFYLATMAFLAALGWAILETFTRLVPTLDLLGAPPSAAFWSLGVLYLAGAALHVGGVVHAHRLGFESLFEGSVSPPLAAIASLLVPGWGQLLNGARVRAVFALASLWICAAPWLVVTPPLRRALVAVGMDLPAPLYEGWGPLVLLGGPLLLWALAVYDAAACAVARRKGL